MRIPVTIISGQHQERETAIQEKEAAIFEKNEALKATAAAVQESKKSIQALVRQMTSVDSAKSHDSPGH